MFSRSKSTLLITAIILVPILLGMTPLNFSQKIGSGSPFSHNFSPSKYFQCNSCPFHSMVSHHDDSVVSLPSVPLTQNIPNVFLSPLSEPVSRQSEEFLRSLPLRC